VIQKKKKFLFFPENFGHFWAKTIGEILELKKKSTINLTNFAKV
jgi:hypothetical protein